MWFIETLWHRTSEMFSQHTLAEMLAYNVNISTL